MPSSQHERMRRSNPELRPDAAEVRRQSKNADRPELAQERKRTAEELRDVRRAYQQERKEIEGKIAEFSKSHPELAELFTNLRERTRKNYEGCHDNIVQALQKRLEQEYRAIPLTENEIEEQLDAEHLSALPLKEYVELLRRLPPRFFTHVTRQGIRDHFSHHYGGEGEFHQGFEGILEKGSLDSIFDQLLEDGIVHETVKDVLLRVHISPQHLPEKNRAFAELDALLTRSDVAPLSSRFADGKSIHAAIEVVADDYYGSERQNEIFVAWPAAFVAKEYHIGTQRFEIPDNFAPSDAHKLSEYNDYWLLGKNDKRGSLPLDAGVVFLPAEAPVDPHTGSRYETDREGKPVDNPQLTPFLAMLAAPEFKAFSKELISFMHANDRLNTLEKNAQEEERRDGYVTFDTLRDRQKAREEMARYPSTTERYREFCTKWNLTDSRIFNLAKGDSHAAFNLRQLIDAIVPNPTPIDLTHRDNCLSTLSIQYELAQNTEPSRAYWERYFTTSGKKPSKVVYYLDQNPTQALEAFKEAAGITRSTSEVDLKKLYKDNLIGGQGIKEVLGPEAARIREIGREVIEEMYSDQALAAK